MVWDDDCDMRQWYKYYDMRWQYDSDGFRYE